MQAADRSLAEDMVTLRALAREAGKLAQSFMQDGQSAHSWHKQGGSPVTEADIAVNTLCADRLKSARPEYGWLSEETLDDRQARQKDRCWVVDPIDGTRAYLRDDPNWCIGLALVEEGEAVAGVIYAPVLDQFYEAQWQKGAFLNGQPIRVSNQVSEQGCRVIAAQDVLRRHAWPEPWPELTIPHKKPNSTLLRLAFVASGAWDATLILGEKSDWDLAAGVVLVHEAGGTATTHQGEKLMFNRHVPAQRSVIASGNALHPLLVRRSLFLDISDPQDGVSDAAPQTERKNSG